MKWINFTEKENIILYILEINVFPFLSLSIIAHVLESKKCPHTIAGQLLDILVSKSVLLPQNMVEAVSNILEYGSDMEIDIPKFWQYMGAIIGEWSRIFIHSIFDTLSSQFL